MTLKHHGLMRTLYFLLPILVPVSIISVGLATLSHRNRSFTSGQQIATGIPPTIKNETWSYVTVRPGVKMFWWFYPCISSSTSDHDQRIPLVLWLQGGPGVAGSGLGNFLEIGPYNIYSQFRNRTWLTKAHLLFIDNPVGSGFSYASNISLYASNASQVTSDLFEVLKAVYAATPIIKKSPLYIFGQSYGGKMAVSLGHLLVQAIKNGTITNCNFTGIGLLDPLISPVDTINAYTDYLKAFSLIDKSEVNTINQRTNAINQMVKSNLYSDASNALLQLLNYITTVTGYADMYYVINHFPVDLFAPPKVNDTNQQKGPLWKFMNGPIRDKLGIIPQNLTWNSPNPAVYAMLNDDILRSVTDAIGDLLNSNIDVAVLTGQFDGLTNVIGTQAWIDQLPWQNLSAYQQTDKIAIYSKEPKSSKSKVVAFSKKYHNFSYYWILKAGHYAIIDNPKATYMLFKQIIGV